MYMKRLFLLASAWLLLCSAFVFIFAGSSAKAAQTIDITWIDAAHIDVKFKFDKETARNGKTYSGFSTQQGIYSLAAFDQGLTTYTLGGGKPGDCVSEVRFHQESEFGMFSAATAANDIKLWVKDPLSSGGVCQFWEQDGSLPAKNPGNSKIFFEWVDAGAIKTVGKIPYFVLKGSGFNFSPNHSRKIKNFGILSFNKDLGYFQEAGGSSCKSYVTSLNKEKDTGTFFAWNGDDPKCDEKFNYTEIKGIRLAKAKENSGLPAGTGTAPADSDESSQAGESEPTCESLTLDEALSWFACAAIKSLNKVIVQVDNAIFNELKVRESDFDKNNTSAGKQYYEIWSVMRYLAMAFVVIIGLIMVISQAIGEGPFDAYSIKKVMPRLLIAIIGISLSWELMNLAISLVNNIGFGVRALIYTPFGGASAVDVPFNLGVGEGALLSGGTLIITASVLFGLGSVGVLSLFVTAALAVIIGFFVIIFRKILIAMLVISAPIAIICSVLPNTQKVWKIWNESFSKALLMFPLIMAFLAVGRVFSYVSERGDAQSLLQQIVSIFAYFAPYFLIPATFKFAGGVIASVAGMTDRSRGVFDRLKKGRQERRAERVSRFKAGGAYDKNTRRGRIGNRIGGALFDTTDAAQLYGAKYSKGRLFNKRASLLSAKIQNAQVDETQKLFQWMNANGFNDKGASALTGEHRFKGNNRNGGTTNDALQRAGLLGVAPTNLKQMQTIGQIMMESDDETERIGGRALLANAGKLATLNSDPELTNASIAGAGAMLWAQHGFATPDDLANVYNRMIDGKAGKRMDDTNVQAMISRAQLLGQDKRIDLKMGYGVGIGEDGRAVSVYDNPKRVRELVKTFKVNDFVGAKAGAVKSLIDSGAVADLALNDPDPYIRQAVQEGIIQGASQYSYSDPDAKAAWKKLANDIGLGARVEEADAAQAEAQRRAQQFGGGPQQPPGAESPGAGGPAPGAH